MKYFRLMGTMLVLSVAMVACGGSAPSTTLEVDMREFLYEPNDFTVPAGEEITLELSNTGAVAHDFMIMDAGYEVGQDFGEEDEPHFYFKAELQPGASEIFTFTAPSQSGDFQVVCGMPGHYIAGMIATLHVVEE